MGIRVLSSNDSIANSLDNLISKWFASAEIDRGKWHRKIRCAPSFILYYQFLEIKQLDALRLGPEQSTRNNRHHVNISISMEESRDIDKSTTPEISQRSWKYWCHKRMVDRHNILFENSMKSINNFRFLFRKYDAWLSPPHHHLSPFNLLSTSHRNIISSIGSTGFQFKRIPWYPSAKFDCIFSFIDLSIVLEISSTWAFRTRSSLDHFFEFRQRPALHKSRLEIPNTILVSSSRLHNCRACNDKERTWTLNLSQKSDSSVY